VRTRIVLVALPWMRDSDWNVPLGHASLLATLNDERDLDSRSVVMSVNRDGFAIASLTQVVLEQLKGIPSGQGTVAVGAYVWNDKQVKGLLRSLRVQGFQGRIVLGGPQISYAGCGLEQIYPEADAFIRGNGEIALRALATTNGRPSIKGVHYAGQTDSCEQATAELSQLPSPWLGTREQLTSQTVVRWETQRGCNFRCSFCQHRQPDSRTPVAMLAESRIKSEIDLFCQAAVKRITVLDPVFNRDRSHAAKVLQRFAQHGFQGELSLQCRAEMVDDEFLDAAQALDVSLEFGLQSIHKREYLAVGRPNSIDKIKQVLQDVQRRKIKHEVSLIYGLPEQTLESFKETVRWCLEMKIPVIKAFPLLLLRGTALEMTREQWSLTVIDNELPMVVESKTFSVANWEAMEKIASALASTEGTHPGSLNELIWIASNGDFSSGASQLRALGKA
jgi:radical SAM superfamily enzyme YgiQ (UPF0313 family)